MSRRPDPITWRKGPPPHVGWWNASLYRDEDVWRYWNGKRWSESAISTTDPKLVAQRARRCEWEKHQAHIEWRHQYPADARVPRIKP